MCGIAGFSLSKRDQAKGISARLARELALAIEHRGRDATGIGWTQADDDGTPTVWVQKDNVTARALAPHFEIGRKVRTCIVHTRFATQGAPEDNLNNHPIERPGLLMVHNGVVRNDDDLFAMLDTERFGEVDSEAAAALLQHGPNIWHGAEPTDLLPLVRGSAALAWLNLDDPHTLHLARHAGSPLVVAGTVGGSLLFASEQHALRRAAMAAGLLVTWSQSISEGTYLVVKRGRVVKPGLRYRAELGAPQYRRPDYKRPSRFELVAGQ